MKTLLWIMLLLICPGVCLAQKATVQYHDGRADRTVPISIVDNVVYFSVSAVSELFSAAKYWRQESRQLALNIGQHKLVLMANNPNVMVDDKIWKLSANVIYNDGRMWVPIQFVDVLIDTLVPERISWDGELRLLSLTAADSQLNVTALDFVSEARGTKAVIKLAQPLKCSVSKNSPGHLALLIEGGRAEAKKLTQKSAHGYISKVIATNSGKGLKLDFSYSKAAKSYEIEPFGDRIEIIFLSQDVNEKPREAELRIKKQETGPNYISNLDLIVIDAGHGGKDAGASGPTGVMEKDITLDIAKRLAEAIETDLGINTYLTRTDDTFIPLGKRTEIANNLKADLFISIHCNASPTKTSHGTETYFLSLAKTTEARAVAARENASLKYEKPDNAVEKAGDLDFILWDLAQYEYLEESSLLAEMTQEELGARLNTASRRVNQAPFYVLNGAFMPAILVETAFITNKNEEKQLNTANFRQKVADAVTQAVSRYKVQYDKKMAQNN